MRALFVIIALVLMPSLAKAACPAAPVGSAQDRVIQMVAGGDNQTQMGSDAVVNSTEEGAIVYDATNKAIAVCDGTNWVHSGGGGGGGGGGCVLVGQFCDDGTILAGLVERSAFFVADQNQSTPILFSTNLEDNVGARSETDGQANQAWIVANRTLSQYPAFQVCENLNRNGHSDWYLPSVDELSVMQGVIGGFNHNKLYWSSTERNYGWNFRWQFSSGIAVLGTKNKSNHASYVRCVRRD